MSEEITHQFPNNGYTVILSRLDSLDSGMVELKGRMTTLEDKVDRRLMETRPIWEQVLQKLEAMDSRFDGMDTRFDGMDTRFDGMDTRFDGMDTRFDGMDTRFDGIETRLGGVETRLDGVEIRLGSVEARLGDVEGRLGKMEHQVYHLGKKIRFLHQEIVDDQNAWEDLEERVATLEKPPANQSG